MLSINTMSPDRAGYYLSLAREDYFFSGGEPPGLWMGRGAARLGLIDQVEPQALRNLFRGFDPEGTNPLVRIPERDGQPLHRPGFDLTFSAPKSVSALWSQVSPSLRSAIQQAHHEAVKAGISFLEESVAVARRGNGGTQAERCEFIVACFEHSTSRALDPQLHTHALLMNIGFRSDGTPSTLNGTPLLLAKMATGALYRVELATRLERMGLCVVRDRFGFKIEGVPDVLVDQFSQRRAAIEEELQRAGFSGAVASAAAALTTRQAKEVASRSTLLKQWQDLANELGWSTQSANELFCQPVPWRDEEEESKQAQQSAIKVITDREAHFTGLDFLRRFAEECQCRGLSAADVRLSCNEFLEKSPSVISIGSYKGRERFTTPEMLELESSILRLSTELASVESHRVDAGHFIKFVSQHPELYEEQMRALYHVAVDSGGLALVSGVAGAGKTYMLGRAKELWEECGFNVIGTALAGRAARQLADESGISSRTVAQLLYDVKRGMNPLNRQSILVVDEAGMIDNRTWEELARLCRDSGAKLCAVGHEQQLQPIGPGNPLPELGARHGMTRLVENRRQKEEWLRNAVGDVLQGEGTSAVKALIERGMLTVHPTKSEAMGALVRQWRDDSFDPSQSLILASTRRDVKQLNSLAQLAMFETGALSGPSLEVGGDSVFRGDRVVFTKTSGPRGIEKGTRGTVLEINVESQAVIVKTDLGDQITVRIIDFPHVALGYASTTHGAQGSTVSYAYDLPGGPMQDRELSYVQISRAKLATRVFVTAADVGDGIAEFAQQIARSRQKEMAHRVVREVGLQQMSSGHDLSY